MSKSFTFPIIISLPGIVVRRNTETGVEIHSEEGIYRVMVPVIYGQSEAEAYTKLADATASARAYAKDMRATIATAYDAATLIAFDEILDSPELAEILDMPDMPVQSDVEPLNDEIGTLATLNTQFALTVNAGVSATMSAITTRNGIGTPIFDDVAQTLGMPATMRTPMGGIMVLG